jgi:hypothetical protein
LAMSVNSTTCPLGTCVWVTVFNVNSLQ